MATYGTRIRMGSSPFARTGHPDTDHPTQKINLTRKKGGSSGGSGGMSKSKIMDEYQKAYDEAKQANLQRYEEILGRYEGMYEKGMGYIESRNLQGQADIEQAYAGREAKMQQEMVNRGLRSSTVPYTMGMGIEREKQAELRRLENDILQQKLSAHTGMESATLGFMERREDPYPDYRMYASLLQSLGQGSAYSGGGGVSFGRGRRSYSTRRRRKKRSLGGISDMSPGRILGDVPSPTGRGGYSPRQMSIFGKTNKPRIADNLGSPRNIMA